MCNILVHGLGQNSSSWDKTISYILEKDNIMCPELSSFIQGEDVTYSELYNNFSRYCGSVAQPLNLCGLSLGAVLALNYTIDNPKKVKSLVLLAPQYEMPRTLLKLQNIIFGFMPEMSFKSIGMAKKDLIKLTNSMMDLNFNEGLKDISCPVLVLCGEKDAFNKKAAKKIAKNIISSEVQFIKDGKHEVNIDAPKELAEILNRFYYG